MATMSKTLEQEIKLRATLAGYGVSIEDRAIFIEALKVFAEAELGLRTADEFREALDAFNGVLERNPQIRRDRDGDDNQPSGN